MDFIEGVSATSIESAGISAIKKQAVVKTLHEVSNLEYDHYKIVMDGFEEYRKETGL